MRSKNRNSRWGEKKIAKINREPEEGKFEISEKL